MRLLNLFSGTDSVAIPWRENNHEVINVDIDPRYRPEICEDILQLSYCQLPTPDVIWSSPPCDQYSRARTRAKQPRNLALADSLVAKAIEFIKYFQKLNPDLIWFLENGQTMLWERDVARSLTNYDVLDYCQYNGPGYRKRMRIAHSDNLYWIRGHSVTQRRVDNVLTVVTFGPRNMGRARERITNSIGAHSTLFMVSPGSLLRKS